MDFTDLNKVCPKDPFPMPQIDQLVDATVGHPRMSFLYIFQGYHQIPLALEDQEKTAFVTPTGNYHYKVIPFGLKNAGSTYQRMMTRMFEPQLGKNIEIYVDDSRPFYLLINKWKGFEWSEDCTAAFQHLKEYLSQPLIMSSPPADEVLYAYIVVAPHAVSLILIREDNGLQRPVYYVSKSLHEAEVRYSPLEKAILAVVHISRKLPHYFQAHTIVVLT